jgi:hypothetical protein
LKIGFTTVVMSFFMKTLAVSLSVRLPTPLPFSIIWAWACFAYAALLPWFPLVVSLMLGLIAPSPLFSMLSPDYAPALFFFQLFDNGERMS